MPNTYSLKERKTLHELLESYKTPAPRYTSYPIVPFWKDMDESEYFRALATLTTESAPISLYIHLPFCKTMCCYCGCNAIAGKPSSMVDTYLDALEVEMDTVSSRLRGATVQKIHLGGGTPTYLTPSQLERLSTKLQNQFEICEDAELSVEVEPTVVSPLHFRELARAGFRRLSLGGQDLDADVQAKVRRTCTAEDLARVMDTARNAGFTSINADLMYGLPGQTQETIGKTLEFLIESAIDRIALFGYAHIPSLKPHQRLLEQYDRPGPHERLDLFIAARDTLVTHGYIPVGFDHFSHPNDSLAKASLNGTLHRNFQGYTTDAATTLIGLGVSAVSQIQSSYFQNAKRLSDYMERANSKKAPITKGIFLNPDDEVRRSTIHELMCTLSISLDQFHDMHDIAFWDYFGNELPSLKSMEEAHLVEFSKSQFKLTELGRVFLRTVAQSFDSYARHSTNHSAALPQAPAI